MNWNNVQYYFVLIYRKILTVVVSTPEIKFILLICISVIGLFLIAKLFIPVF